MVLNRSWLFFAWMFFVLGGGSIVQGADEPEGLKIDKEKKTVTIACKVAPRKLEKHAEIYPIEAVATYPDPKGQKAHETVVTFDVKPSDIHAALESFGLKPGKPAKGEGEIPAGPEVKISLEIGGRLVPAEKCLIDKKTGKSLPTLKWLFTGSIMKQPDPNKPETVYAADQTGTLIAVFPVTNETVFQTNLTMKEEPILKMDTDKTRLPKEGESVKMVIEAK